QLRCPRRSHRRPPAVLPPPTLAPARYPASPCQLPRIQPTICSIDALNASTRRCLAPTMGTYASCADPRSTVPAGETPIAPADSGAHSPAVSFPGGFRTPARDLDARGELSGGAGIRNPSQYLRPKSGLNKLHVLVRCPLRSRRSGLRSGEGARSPWLIMAGSSSRIDAKASPSLPPTALVLLLKPPIGRPAHAGWFLLAGARGAPAPANSGKLAVAMKVARANRTPHHIPGRGVPPHGGSRARTVDVAWCQAAGQVAHTAEQAEGRRSSWGDRQRFL